MYKNNLKKLRNEKDLTQEELCKDLKLNRNTYNNWERGIVMLPVDIADKLSIYYNVKLSCIFGIEQIIKYDYKIKKMNYNILLSNLTKLKQENKNTFDELGLYLKCTGATCQRYFTSKIKIPMDRLILLAEFYNIDLDKLCNKI